MKKAIILNAVKFKFSHKIIIEMIVYFLGVFAAIIYILSVNFAEIADFFQGSVGFCLRFLLSKITYFLPFSFGEFILFVSLPIFIFWLVKFVINITKSEDKRKMLFANLRGIMAVLSGFWFVYVFALAIGAQTTPINQKIGFERRLISVEDLSQVMQFLTSEANAESENIRYIYANGSTKMPYGLSELNIKLNSAYKNLLEKHDFTRYIKAKVKPIIISEVFSRLHITGIYSFFSCEANVNINFPDYNLPFTAAHEMAHLMGITREDEANFVAFLVCFYSEDSYIKYSGYVNLIEYLRGPLYNADLAVYREITDLLSPIINREFIAYSEFFNKYRDAKIAQVSSSVNDAYLKSQGQNEGVKSYNLVVDLDVAYICDVYKFTN